MGVQVGLWLRLLQRLVELLLLLGVGLLLGRLSGGQLLLRGLVGGLCLLHRVLELVHVRVLGLPGDRLLLAHVALLGQELLLLLLRGL